MTLMQGHELWCNTTIKNSHTAVTTIQTKQHNWILSLLKQLCVSSLLLYCIIIHVLASMSLPYFMYFIQCALDFCKVRIKLLGLTFKGKQNIFLYQQPLSPPPSIALYCLILTFRSNYDTYCHSFSTNTIDLHIDSARIFGYCMSSLIILVVPVDLHNLCMISSECKHVMSCIWVG